MYGEHSPLPLNKLTIFLGLNLIFNVKFKGIFMIYIDLRSCLCWWLKLSLNWEVWRLAVVLSSSFLQKILGAWLISVSVLTHDQRPCWNWWSELFVINCSLAKISIRWMQNYLWIWNALSKHYGHLKQWGQHYGNDNILFFFRVCIFEQLFGFPRWDHKVGRDGGESPTSSPNCSPSISAAPGLTSQRSQILSHATKLHWCSLFLKKEALTLELKVHPLHAPQFIGNSPHLWFWRAYIFLNPLSPPKNREERNTRSNWCLKNLIFY